MADLPILYNLMVFLWAGIHPDAADGWNKVENSGCKNSVHFDLQPPQSEKVKKLGELEKGTKTRTTVEQSEIGGKRNLENFDLRSPQVEEKKCKQKGKTS